MEFTDEDFIKYKQYLNVLTEQLNIFFEDQKEYICCKKGCSLCCEKGTYPYSELEFKYLLLGFFQIEHIERQKVINRIKELKRQYELFEDKQNFSHRCPFLSDDNICLVYDCRGLICRTFGLLTELDDGSLTLPFCSTLGLNYSKVYLKDEKKIDYEAIKKLGYKNYPLPRRTNLKTLMSKEIFIDDPINFGEIKALIEWL